ncbi:tyrosine-type recombinase/integrase [Aeoliella sp. SH292]|uniref:tyrosine-type recombinase/integrase n=1 Tax=Aeoliella sp. SH292 TaxID=3454464 RepID=UPI003F984F67
MLETIKVHVVHYADRTNLVMRYKCPLTGKHVPRTTGTSNAKEAAKAAAKWEAELQEGRYQRSSRMGWDEFVEYVDTNHLSTMAVSSADTYLSTLSVFKEACRPEKLADVTTAKVTYFRTKLQQQGRKPATIAKHLRTLAAVLNWAKEQGILATVPKCNMPKGWKAGQRAMKGRPISGEEFDRMLAKVASEVGEDKAAAWTFYLRALWESGLRLTESLTLSWDERPDAISVDMEGRRPMLRIPAAVEKGKRNRLLPMTPELAELLLTVPQGDRRGRVFKGIHHHYVNVSQTVSDIGKAAGVIVTPSVGTKGQPGYKGPKYASAHDLRRAFGTRLSRRPNMSVARLKSLMRHADIATTMAYYVEEQCDELADALWENHKPAAEVPSEVPSGEN